MEKKSGGQIAAVVLLGVLCVFSLVMLVYIKTGCKTPALAQTGAKRDEAKLLEDEPAGEASAAEEPAAEASAYGDFSMQIDAFMVSAGQSAAGPDGVAREAVEMAVEEDEYLCSFSAARRMNEDDVKDLIYGSYGELPEGKSIAQMVVNEMYARHGYRFNNEEIQAYFEKKQWYRDIDRKETDMDKIYRNMTDLEKANIDLLSNYREE